VAQPDGGHVQNEISTSQPTIPLPIQTESSHDDFNERRRKRTVKEPVQGNEVLQRVRAAAATREIAETLEPVIKRERGNTQEQVLEPKPKISVRSSAHIIIPKPTTPTILIRSAPPPPDRTDRKTLPVEEKKEEQEQINVNMPVNGNENGNGNGNENGIVNVIEIDEIDEVESYISVLDNTHQEQTQIVESEVYYSEWKKKYEELEQKMKDMQVKNQILVEENQLLVEENTNLAKAVVSMNKRLALKQTLIT